MKTDPRVDVHIEAAEAFARPILLRLRDLVHASAVDAEEEIKWGRPFFTLGGRPFCFMAAFKAHAAFGFWQGLEPTGREGEAAGALGRLATIADLPPEPDLKAMIVRAAALASGERPKRPPRMPRPPLPVPDDLESALRLSEVAAQRFAALSPGHRREYIEWIEEAKRPETRARRIAATVEKLAAGETLNARYAGR